LCEPDEGKRARIAATYSLQQNFANLLQAPLEQFDVVLVATPAPLQISQALLAAEAGCHVLCEKPLSDSEEGIQQLIDTLRAKQRIGATAYTLRSTGAARKMKSMIDAGNIGMPRFATAEASQHFPSVRPDYRDIYFAREAMGGGVLFDMCPHMVNLLEWFFGPEQDISCYKQRLVLEGIETDDISILNVRYHSGALAHINTVLFGRNYRAETVVHGSEGTLVYDRIKSELAFFTDGKPGSPPVEVHQFAVGHDEPYVEQAQMFLTAIRGEGEVVCTLEEGWQTLSAVFAAQRSAASGCSEVVPAQPSTA
jgi:predicted dehydrogenase